MDRYSGWLSDHYFANTTAISKGLVVDALRGWFMIFGVLEELPLDVMSYFRLIKVQSIICSLFVTLPLDPEVEDC